MSAQIDIDRESQIELSRQLNKLDKYFPKSSRLMIIKMGSDIKRDAQNRLKDRSHVITSRLRNSIFKKTTGNTTIIGSNVEYAATIEKGSKPHEIKAKNAKVLGNKKVGFFGKKVNHPGFKGDSFLRWAYDKAIKRLDYYRDYAIKETIKKVKK